MLEDVTVVANFEIDPSQQRDLSGSYIYESTLIITVTEMDYETGEDIEVEQNFINITTYTFNGNGLLEIAKLSYNNYSDYEEEMLGLRDSYAWETKIFGYTTFGDILIISSMDNDVTYNISFNEDGTLSLIEVGSDTPLNLKVLEYIDFSGDFIVTYATHEEGELEQAEDLMTLSFTENNYIETISGYYDEENNHYGSDFGETKIEIVGNFIVVYHINTDYEGNVTEYISGLYKIYFEDTTLVLDVDSEKIYFEPTTIETTLEGEYLFSLKDEYSHMYSNEIINGEMVYAGYRISTFDFSLDGTVDIVQYNKYDSEIATYGYSIVEDNLVFYTIEDEYGDSEYIYDLIEWAKIKYEDGVMVLYNPYAPEQFYYEATLEKLPEAPVYIDGEFSTVIDVLYTSSEPFPELNVWNFNQNNQ